MVLGTPPRANMQPKQVLWIAGDLQAGLSPAQGADAKVTGTKMSIASVGWWNQGAASSNVSSCDVQTAAPWCHGARPLWGILLWTRLSGQKTFEQVQDNQEFAAQPFFEFVGEPTVVSCKPGLGKWHYVLPASRSSCLYHRADGDWCIHDVLKSENPLKRSMYFRRGQDDYA